MNPAPPYSESTDIASPAAKFILSQSQEARERVPWLLFLFLWAVLFPVFDQFGSPSYPYDYQSVSSMTEATQSGDIFNMIAIPILGLSGLILIVRRRDKFRLQRVIGGLLIAFLSLNFLSVIWSSDPALTAKRLVSLGLMALFAAGCVVRMNAFLLALFVGGFQLIRLAAGFIFEISTDRFHPFSSDYRYCGTAPHPNVEAAFLSVAFLVFSWLWWEERGKAKIYFLLATLIAGGFLLLTVSRTSAIAALIALASSAALKFLRNRKGPLLTVFALLTLILSSGILLNLAVFNDSDVFRLPGAMSRSDDEGSATELSGRVDLWKSLVPYIARRPLSGYGFGGFWITQRIEDVSSDQGWVIQQSHSGYIDQILAIGIPGAIVYIALLISCIGYQLGQCQDRYGVWLAILIFILIHNVTESINVFSSLTNLVFYMVVINTVITRVETDKLLV